MKLPSFLFILFLILCCPAARAQKNTATVSGTVVDENERPLAGVSVLILGKQSGTSTNEAGLFEITVPAGRAFALVFSYSGLRGEQRNFLLSEGEAESVRIRLLKGEQTLEEVVVRDQRDRREHRVPYRWFCE